MDHQADPKECIIEYIAHLSVIERPWEGTLRQEEEDAEGNCRVLPPEEDEEVR